MISSVPSSSGQQTSSNVDGGILAVVVKMPSFICINESPIFRCSSFFTHYKSAPSLDRAPFTRLNRDLMSAILKSPSGDEFRNAAISLGLSSSVPLLASIVAAVLRIAIP